MLGGRGAPGVATRGRQRPWACCDGGRKKKEKVVSEVYDFSNGRRQSYRRHRRAVDWAERVRWAGREAEAQWGEGERPVEKKTSGPQLGRLAAGPKEWAGRLGWNRKEKGNPLKIDF
jgi:hypothetical protein